jgi:hypothetical protein
LAANQGAECESKRNAQGETCCDQYQNIAHNQPNDITLQSAESDPEAKFARSTSNGVRHDAVKADGGQQSGKSAEYRRETGY